MITPHLSAITTDLSWDDVTLNEDTAKQVEEIKTWFKQSPMINHEGAEKNKKLARGYRSLFYGPAGSGKKLTAALIVKSLISLSIKSIFQNWYQNILVNRKKQPGSLLPPSAH